MSLLQLFWVLFFSLMCFCHVSAAARGFKEPWHRVQWKGHTPRPEAQSAFLMLSNRPMDFTRSHFAAERSDTNCWQYLYVVDEDSAWKIYPFYTLNEALKSLPNRDWVIYTEGMGKTFYGNLRRASAMRQTYQVNVVLFDYASMASDLGIIQNFRMSMRNAAQGYAAYFRMMDTIRMRRATFKEQTLSLFFHSMGNLLLEVLVQSGLTQKWNAEPFIDNLILNAPCTNRKGHHRWLNRIQWAKRKWVHYNRADTKLNGAALLSGNRKLGSKPKYPFDRSTYYIDFNRACERTHNYFLDIPERSFRRSWLIMAYFEVLLHGKVPDMSKWQKSKVVGWEMPRA
ncbi:MAG TPA: hypothetical protein DCF44_10310 [Chitinophagaceae bacterium]|nr:hypothetical protein [Chitinophagaceae bacterium]